jgi:hypothetical protein
VRIIQRKEHLPCTTPDVEAYRWTEGEVQVEVCGPSDTDKTPFAGEQVVCFYLGVEGAEFEDAEFVVPLARLRSLLEGA